MRHSIREYLDKKGRSPYNDWLRGVRDARAKARVIMQVDRMELGLFGDSRPVGQGVRELRIHYGPGYRVYYAREQIGVCLVLCGGDKTTQTADIRRAKDFWQDYKQRRS